MVPYNSQDLVTSRARGQLDRAHHTKTHSLVTVYKVAEIFARCSDGNALPVSQFVQPALDAEVGFPILTVGYDGSENMRRPFAKYLHVPAPPAIVPSKYGLISMTFFTVPEAVSLFIRDSHTIEYGYVPT